MVIVEQVCWEAGSGGTNELAFLYQFDKTSGYGTAAASWDISCLHQAMSACILRKV